MGRQIEREIQRINDCIRRNDFILARQIIVRNIQRFENVEERNLLSLEALTFVNTVAKALLDDSLNVHNRETTLIIQRCNALASEGRFGEIKRFYFLHKDLLSIPSVYNLLNVDAKICIPAPKEDKKINEETDTVPEK